jgi:tetratricopeptide (TPR) repeat protein
VKVFQRGASLALAMTLCGLSASVALAQPRAAAPDANTPRLLVAVFQSNDRASGVQAADAIRTRIQNGANVRQLYVIPRTDITNYLESSGYKADSSLGPTDLKELAKLLRADEVLFGSVTRSATGLRVEPRLLLARDVSLAQPLPMVDAANPPDAARQIERSLQEARKQLADYKACESHIRAKTYLQAIASANAGIAKYPNATLARLCLASAYQEMKLPPDSILRVVSEIRRIDPKNSFAVRLAYGAYDVKGDSENAVRALVQLLNLEPTNPTLQTQVINALAKLGKPAVAIPIVDTLLIASPGDPQLLRSKWLLTLAAAASDSGAMRLSFLDAAVRAGEEMVRGDTTLADSVYYSRQVAAASGLTTNPARAVEFASRAVQKYPNSAEFWALKANAERKAGQLQVAQQSIARALSVDPKYPNGNLLLAQISLEMNQPDSAVGVARRAVAAGEDAKTWGAFLLAPTQAAFKKAQESKLPEDYERALALAQESEKLATSQTAGFFIGVASFQIAIDAVQKAQKPKSCALAKKAQEMFLLTQANMNSIGRTDAATAQQLINYSGQYAPVADQMVKQYCK